CEATGVAIGFGSVLSTARTCSKGTLTDTSKRLQLDVEDQVLLVVFRGSRYGTTKTMFVPGSTQPRLAPVGRSAIETAEGDKKLPGLPMSGNGLPRLPRL